MIFQLKNSMFRFGVFGVRSMSSAVKRTTGIVGLPVAERAQETLVGLYTQTLEALEAIPPSSQYRVNVEKMTQVRLDAVRASRSAAELESSVRPPYQPHTHASTCKPNPHPLPLHQHPLSLTSLHNYTHSHTTTHTTLHTTPPIQLHTLEYFYCPPSSHSPPPPTLHLLIH